LAALFLGHPVDFRCVADNSFALCYFHFAPKTVQNVDFALRAALPIATPLVGCALIKFVPQLNFFFALPFPKAGKPQDESITRA